MVIKVPSLILTLVLISGTGAIRNSGLVSAQTRQNQQHKSARYACPMHPEVTSAKPRKCPKCGMSLRLVADKVDSGRAPARDASGEAPADTLPISSIRIPDTRVYDQHGNQLKFYSDLIKGKTVAINFIFTTCTTICPSLTATFRRVQQDLAEHALHVQLISISVDPTTDTPERLREFAATFNAGPGWTFITGDKSEIDSLLQTLGAGVGNKNDHTPMVLIGNDVTGYWTRTYGLAPPAALVQMITETTNRK